jgi:hypothetical protein
MSCDYESAQQLGLHATQWHPIFASFADYQCVCGNAKGSSSRLCQRLLRERIPRTGKTFVCTFSSSHAPNSGEQIHPIVKQANSGSEAATLGSSHEFFPVPVAFSSFPFKVPTIFVPKKNIYF